MISQNRIYDIKNADFIVKRHLIQLFLNVMESMIYKSFIKSNFNHCSIVWHFCNQSSVNKMEKIQERALRFILSSQVFIITLMLLSIYMH